MQCYLNGDVSVIAFVEGVSIVISMHGHPFEKVLVKVENDGADLKHSLAHYPSKLDPNNVFCLQLCQILKT